MGHPACLGHSICMAGTHWVQEDLIIQQLCCGKKYVFVLFLRQGLRLPKTQPHSPQCWEENCEPLCLPEKLLFKVTQICLAVI